MGFTSSMYNGGSETATLNDTVRTKDNRADFSLNTSQTTTRSNTPPSPTSPLEMTKTYTNSNSITAKKTNGSLMPNPDDFKKSRASTGLAFRSRAINFGGNSGSPGKDKQPKKKHFGRRRSYDSDQATNEATHHHHIGHRHIEPSPWPQMPDAGVGVKSRRLSISLPDDFHVEVADLQLEYEYQNKFFGRHGKHLGKGATSKVTLMSRKGFVNELYAVKEFRNKSKAETTEDYDNKVKSEYSIAKSLHHPNIVETIQLCSDHGRWNHVMEYCSDGDLFQLVEKGYLKSPDRAADRLCLFKQVVQGVNYLHSNGIAHRDIKLENCLITNGSKLKITDFGVSEVFSGTHPGLREAGGQCGQNMCDLRLCSPGICGSEPYIAPEVLSKKEKYDPRGMDVWGSAIIMIFLTFGANIWKRAEVNSGSQHYDVFVKQWEKWNAKHTGEDARITDTDYPYFVPFDQFVSPPALRRVLLTMLNPDPAKRATISEVINHRWVKNIECCQLDSYDDPSKYIDASKPGATRVNGQRKIFCHNHLPLVSHGHSLGKMPGQTGY
jgi:serine/threonine protein kinase